MSVKPPRESFEQENKRWSYCLCRGYRYCQKRVYKKDVLEARQGSDGEVRDAVFKVADSTLRPKLLRRSVKHLIPIEVSA